MAAAILVFSGSLRTGSFNTKLADLAEQAFRAKGAEVTRLDLGQYPLPLYDADLESASGFSPVALALHELFRGHQGIFIATPEYNAGVPPLVSNLLAWVSRIREGGGAPAAFGKPVFALGAASPGALGGYRGLMALRQQLELGLNARVLPAMVSVPSAADAYDEAGKLKNERSAQAIARVADQLIAAAG